ncbi:MAG: GNAT family N-acetyltransferase [Lachnospiraceae bacterium]|nr:GNAT family N-acetyltransferase [Lachnospiraceae bacterium]
MKYLKKTEYITDRMPLNPEEGTLYVLTPDAFLCEGNYPDIPYVLYRDTLKDGSPFEDGVKYVLEGEGKFNPEYFDEDYLEKIYRRLLRIPWDILETDRCVIRETTVSDLDSFYEIYSDPGITRFMEDLMERSEEEKYTENYRDLIYDIYGHGIWTVILRETGEVIGRAGLDERAGFSTPELGFMIGTKWQRRGLALEVCEGIMRWAAEEGMDTVMSLTERENAASVHLLEKLGFLAEDTVEISGTELVRYLKKM